jgi:hypothetical protein
MRIVDALEANTLKVRPYFDCVDLLDVIFLCVQKAAAHTA